MDKERMAERARNRTEEEREEIRSKQREYARRKNALKKREQ